MGTLTLNLKKQHFSEPFKADMCYHTPHKLLRRLVPEMARVQSQVRQYEICGGKSTDIGIFLVQVCPRVHG
jgi:hypothetical protein